MLGKRRIKKEKKTKFHVKKNDLVEVNTGEEKGRRGRILDVIADKQQAIARYFLALKSMSDFVELADYGG